MRLLYFLLLVIFLGGCSSKKKLMIQTDQKTEYFEQKDVQEHKTESRDSAGQRVTEIVQVREAESETETTTKTIEYDTSKPINQDTGRPPVLRETESTTRAKKKAKEDTTGKQDEKSVVSDKDDELKIDNTRTHKTEDNSGKLDQDNERTFFQIPWLWIIIGALVVACVGYCWKKKINPLKWILRI